MLHCLTEGANILIPGPHRALVSTTHNVQVAAICPDPQTEPIYTTIAHSLDDLPKSEKSVREKVGHQLYACSRKTLSCRGRRRGVTKQG